MRRPSLPNLRTGAAVAALSCFTIVTAFAQVDSTYSEEDEEDYSLYDDLEYVDEGTKRFANAKIKGLSPAQFISVGYDFQGPHQLTAAAFGDELYQEETADINAAHGLRVGANIPVYSKNSLIVQVGGQFWDVNYDIDREAEGDNPLVNALQNNGLRTVGLNSTIYKPLNEYSFILVQLQADMNGDWAIPDFQGLQYTRYSGAALWGGRPKDNLQWGVGVARTYRAGELNYVPIVMYNWTSLKSKWGCEVLFPARGHMRYTFNPRNMLLMGFALEGGSYRIGNQGNALADPYDELEIRRGELRFRANYQRQLIGFFWMSLEAGYRVNYSFNVDSVPDGQDFSRYFILDEPLTMENALTNPFYVNFSINFVSP